MAADVLTNPNQQKRYTLAAADTWQQVTLAESCREILIQGYDSADDGTGAVCYVAMAGTDAGAIGATAYKTVDAGAAYSRRIHRGGSRGVVSIYIAVGTNNDIVELDCQED